MGRPEERVRGPAHKVPCRVQQCRKVDVLVERPRVKHTVHGCYQTRCENAGAKLFGPPAAQLADEEFLDGQLVGTVGDTFVITQRRFGMHQPVPWPV